MSATQESNNFLVDCICMSQFLKRFNLLHRQQNMSPAIGWYNPNSMF